MHIASVIADLHLDDWTRWAHKTHEGSNTRLEAQLSVIKNLIGASPSTDLCIIAGDTANPRKESLPLALSNGITDLMNFCSKTFKDTYVIEGNHDYPWRTPEKGKLSSVSISKRSNVHVIEGGKIIKIPLSVPGAFVEICLLSYQPTEDILKSAVSSLIATTSGNRILIAHQPLMEGMLDTGGLAIKGNSVDSLQPDKWKLILLGDYHRPQKIRANVYYCGSPYELNRGDAKHDGGRGLIDIHYDPISAQFMPSFRASTHTGMKFLTIPITNESEIDQHVALHKDDFVTLAVTAAGATRFSAIEEKGRKLFTFPPEVINEGSFKAVELIDNDRQDGITLNADPKLVVATYLRKRSWDNLSVDALIATCHHCLDRIPQSSTSVYRGYIVFKELKLKNWFSHTDTTVKLNDIGLVLLDGDNGHGKSSILEGIYFALFGKLLREGPTKKTRYRFNDEDCTVELTLSTEHNEIKIKRTVPFKGSEFTKIYRNNVEEPVFAGAQNRIYDMTGISESYFKAAGILSANVLSRFIVASSAERQKIIQEMIDTEPYDLAAKVASEILKGIESDMVNLDALAQRALGAKEEAETSISRMESEKNIHRIRSEAARKEYTTKIEEGRKRLDSYNTALAVKNEALALIVKPSMEVPPECIALEAEAAKWQNDVNMEHRKIGSYDSDVKKATSLKEKMQNYKFQGEGVKCPTCLQKVTEEHIASCLAAADVDGRDAQAELTKISDVIYGLNQKIKANIDKAKELRSKHEQSFHLNMAQYNTAMNEVRSMSSTIQMQIAEINAYNIDLTKIESTDSGYDAAIERAKLVIVENTAVYNNRKAELEKVSMGKPYMQAAVNCFGNSGVKNFLLDNITPTICKEAMKYLDLVSPGQYNINSGIKSTAVQDKLVFEVTNAKGSEDARLNSDGEKGVVDLCLIWAINRVAVRWNILYFDEPFSAFDGKITPKAFRLLESAANEGRDIIATTHRDDLKNFFPVRWLVEKTEVNGCPRSILTAA